MKLQILPQQQEMSCREIVGSNLATSTTFRTHGLTIHIDSSPYQNSRVGGGDVYYVTTCESPVAGVVSRLILADVSGHGVEASGVANSLRSSLQKNVNQISQSGFARKLNQEFTRTTPGDRFVTAVVATYFESQKRMSFGVAGHPNPLLFRSAENRWFKVDGQVVDDRNRLFNVPFGLCEGSTFPTRNVSVEKGDMFVLYSDAFTESLNSRGEPLGVDGVVAALNQLTDLPRKEIVSALSTNLRALDPANLESDDATMILGHFTN